MNRPRLAVFDLAVIPTSPAGSCVRTQLRALAADFDITVFSAALDDPDGRLTHRRVPLPARPLLARYALFHVLAGARYAAWRTRRRGPVLVQATQGQFPGAQVVYAHFCHRAYLAGPWRAARALGLRRIARGALHRYNAWAEAAAFRRARVVVVPSQGLKDELLGVYPRLGGRIEVIPNPVDVVHFARPVGHDRTALRAACGFGTHDRVVAFMALGDFARKGLGLLIEALVALDRPDCKVLVIGGRPAEMAQYARFARQEGVAGQVHFAGFQADVRPWLWAADLLALPSSYETFSLAAWQAAAAGLPVLATPVHGVRELVREGETGFVVQGSVRAVADGLVRALAAGDALAGMGAAAQAQVRADCAPEVFAARWRSVLHAAWARLNGAHGVNEAAAPPPGVPVAAAQEQGRA